MHSKTRPPTEPLIDPRQRVLAVVAAIRPGQVMGYGEVARDAGLPGRARWVAKLLAGNHDPALPWHRVVRSDGRIAFPAGSPGWIEQSARLQAEGVALRNGRVQRRPRTLDELVWGPAPASK
ncbi:MAG: MGMT family protein [Pseudomonadota bacterium]|nr:MGMT family protein [Pseudomonadota bacterium]